MEILVTPSSIQLEPFNFGPKYPETNFPMDFTPGILKDPLYVCVKLTSKDRLGHEEKKSASVWFWTSTISSVQENVIKSCGTSADTEYMVVSRPVAKRRHGERMLMLWRRRVNECVLGQGY